MAAATEALHEIPVESSESETMPEHRHLFALTREDSDLQGSDVQLESEELLLMSPTATATDVLDVSTNTTPSKKSKKGKKKSKRRESKQLSRASGHESSSEFHSLPGSVRSDAVSKSSERKRRKSKRGGKKDFRYNSAALGCVIIPDCDGSQDAAEEEGECSHHDMEEYEKSGSAHLSAYTEPTTSLEDDFTYNTDATTSFKEEPEKPKKDAAKKVKKEKRTKSKDRVKDRSNVRSKERSERSQERTKTKSKDRTKTKSKERAKMKSKERIRERYRERLEARDASHNGGCGDDLSKNYRNKKESSNDGSESWGNTDPLRESGKASLSPELVRLLMDPSLKLNSAGEPCKPPSRNGVKKSTSFCNGKAHKSMSSLTRRSSCHNIKQSSKLASEVPKAATKLETKMRERAGKSKKKKDASVVSNISNNGGSNSNASWDLPKAPGSARMGSRPSYSPELLNLYTSQQNVAPAPNGLRRNVKSFGNMNESWRLDPKRDNDIPSILFLKEEDNLMNQPDSCRSGLTKPSSIARLGDSGSRNLDGTSNSRKGPKSMRNCESTSVLLRKKNGEPTSRSIKRNDSWGAADKHSGKPPMQLRRKESARAANGNAGWGVTGTMPLQPQSGRKSSPLSPELVGMLLNPANNGRTPPLDPSSNSKGLKSPSGRLKKSMSFGGLKKSPSLGGIRNSIANFKKMRGIKESSRPNGIPHL